MHQKRIIIAIPTNGSDGRLRLSGILRYANAKPNWDIHIFTSRTSFTDEEITNVCKTGVDGLILAAYTPAVEKLIDDGTPCILMLDNLLNHLATSNTCHAVLVDNEEIGRIAADQLLALGRFASATYVPDPMNAPWSDERGKAFRKQIGKAAPFIALERPARNTEDLSGGKAHHLETALLTEHLKKLPKPAAVFAANDLFAAQALTICKQQHIDVPKEIAVIGCDNDELVCFGSKPALSSIQPNFDAAGVEAAKMLDRLISRRKVETEILRVGKSKPFLRASTAHLPPAVALVNAAIDYIKKHALDGISTADVIAQLRVSRSLLDLRFRQIRNESVMDAILTIRLEEVKRRLRTTRDKILKIGEDCGFGNADYLKHLFKRRFGISMREYRNRPK